MEEYDTSSHAFEVLIDTSSHEGRGAVAVGVCMGGAYLSERHNAIPCYCLFDGRFCITLFHQTVAVNKQKHATDARTKNKQTQMSKKKLQDVSL